jgi:hypothetical protein
MNIDGRHRETIQALERALADSVRLGGETCLEASKLRIRLAEAYLDADLWTLAHRTIEAAIRDLDPEAMADRGRAFDMYARLLEEQGRLPQAELMRTESLLALENALGSGSLEVAQQIEKYAGLLDRLARPTESDRLRWKAAIIRESLAKGPR